MTLYKLGTSYKIVIKLTPRSPTHGFFALVFRISPLERADGALAGQLPAVDARVADAPDLLRVVRGQRVQGPRHRCLERHLSSLLIRLKKNLFFRPKYVGMKV